MVSLSFFNQKNCHVLNWKWLRSIWMVPSWVRAQAWALLKKWEDKYDSEAMPMVVPGLSWGLSGKESDHQCRKHRFNPWVRKIPWRKKRLPTPVFSPGKSQGQRSPGGYNTWGPKESDTAYQLNNNNKMVTWCSQILSGDIKWRKISTFMTHWACNICAHKIQVYDWKCNRNIEFVIYRDPTAITLCICEQWNNLKPSL